jgi:hypothetical protein
MRSAIIRRTIRYANVATVTCAKRSTVKGEQCKSDVRLRSQNAPDMSGVPLDCPVHQQDKELQWSTAPNPNDHVRCTTGLSGAPSTTTTRIVVGAINTPNHHHSCNAPNFAVEFFSFLYSPKFGRYLSFSLSLAKP